MSERNQELMAIAQEAITAQKQATDPSEQRRYSMIAEQAIVELEKLKEVANKPVGEAFMESEGTQATAGALKSSAEFAGNVAADVQTSLGKAISGLVAAPYELPSMVAEGVRSTGRYFGVDEAVGKAIDPILTPVRNVLGLQEGENILEPGRGYKNVLEFAGANRPYRTDFGSGTENVAEAAVVAAPSLLVPGGAAAFPVIFMAEMTRQTAGDAARHWMSDPETGNLVSNVLEMVPLHPAEFGVVKGKPNAITMTPAMAEQKAQQQAAKAREKGSPAQAKMDKTAIMQAKASDLGFNITQGTAQNNRVLMAFENNLSKMPEAGMLVDADVDNANNFVRWLTSSFNASKRFTDPKTGKRTTDPVRLSAILKGSYEGYKNTANKNFQDKSRALFANISDETTFSSAGILNVLDEIAGPDGFNFKSSADNVRVDQVTNEAAAVRSGIKSLRDKLTEPVMTTKFNPTTLKMEQVPTGERKPRDLSPKELQSILSDMGRLAFKGDNPTWAGAPRSLSQPIAKRIGGAIKELVNDAAASNPELQALKDAREGFDVLLKDMQAAGDLPFIKFFDGTIDNTNVSALVDPLLDMTDLDSQRIMISMLETDAPQVLPVLRERAIQRVIENATVETKLGSGTDLLPSYSIEKLRDGLLDLEEKLLFTDPQSRKAFNQYKGSMSGIIDSLAAWQKAGGQVLENNWLDNALRTMTEVAGVIGDTRERYAGQVVERVAKTTAQALKDPRALASAALTPDMPIIVQKALKQAQMTKEELGRWNAWADSYKAKVVMDLSQKEAENEANIEEARRRAQAAAQAGFQPGVGSGIPQ